MTMNPSTGEGFDAVQVGEEEYFDPQATDETYPGSVGLTMRKKTYWQGDVQFDTFETVGPKFGPKWPNGTMRTGGLGTDADVWGLSDEDPPPPGYAPWLSNGVGGQGGTNSGTNIFVPIHKGPDGVEIVEKHEWTPCFEDDGSPTLGEFEQRNFIDITLLGAYGGDIKFPVMPEEFGADFTHEYWTPRVVGLGEIILPGGQSMETIQWDSFFPARYDADYVSITPLELEDPKSLTARIIWTMRFKMNCMLVVGGGIWNERVVITNFNYRHKAGEVDDIYYSISLKRYRAPVVTTSANPESVKDRWYKDPRGTGVQTDTPTPSGTPDSNVPQDPNPIEIPVEPDPPPPAPVTRDEGPAVAPEGTREALITIETDVIRPFNVAGMKVYDYYSGQEQEIAPAGPAPQIPGETFQQAMTRLSKQGPNDVAGGLALNKWVTDNNYNPYTSHLPIGAGVRYYKENPVAVSKPIVITRPNIGAPETRPDGTVYFPRGEQVAGYPSNTPITRPR
jgi:hypothetical protein